MNILQLLQQDGFNPVLSARTDGGEFSSACPICGGSDRFKAWPEKNKYWCRQCGLKGDLLDYLQKVRRLSFMQAKEISGQPLKDSLGIITPSIRLPHYSSIQRPLVWFENTLKLIEWTENKLHNSQTGIKVLKWIRESKGICSETARQFHLGWNPADVFREKADWGLPEELKADGKKKKLWIPRGLVIPSFSATGKLENIRIRRPSGEPKYFLLPGSSKNFLIAGDSGSVHCFIVESDLDALLLHQEAGDLACFVSTGSTSYRPGIENSEFILSKQKLFLSLDSDEAGAKSAMGYWKQAFPNAIRWPVIYGKDPSEAFNNGLDLRVWVQTAIAE